MKNKKLIQVLLISSISVTMLSACNKSKKKDDDGRQKNEEVEKFEGNYGNTRSYNEAFFENPNNIYRILPVNNDSALAPGGASMSKFDEYMEQGYGGVCTNVAPGDEYLTSESNWEMMQEAVEYGINDLGMRVILYDEDYYPSGGARTLTLDATPEGENWEAQGLVHQTKALVNGTPVTLDSLHGHKLIHAFVYKEGTLNTINPNETIDLLPNLKEGDSYTPSSNGLLVLLYSKNWYEGTHYQNNLLESRRYIDLLKPEPTKEFIRNTYEEYYKRFGKYFGNQIESFFFDEPSMPGMYFQPTNAQVIDELDPLIEQYPAVNFDDQIIARFQEKYKYNPAPYLPYLFEKSNSNDAVRRFRWQYYALLGELIENNWFGQLSDWCQNHNVQSTGHLICEEDLADHPLMMGSYLANYRRMDIAGIDITHGAASEGIVIGAVTAKQATSMTEYNNRHFTFCEIGQDEGLVDNVDENIANVAVLQAFGINYMVSYYHLREHDTPKLTNSIARINYMLDGNVADKNVGVYYPIESIYCDETPYNANGQRIYTGNWGFNEYVSSVGENYRAVVTNLARHQIDYNIFDAYTLKNSEIKNNALVTPNGQEFKTLIIPSATALEEGVLEKLNEASDAGVKVILQNVNKVTSMDEEKQESFNTLLTSLKSKAIVINSKSINDLLERLNTIEGLERVNLSINNPNVIARKQSNGNSTLYMLVNTSNKEQTLTIIADQVGKEYRSWNVYEGVVDGMAVKVENNKSYITVKLPAFNVGIYTIE